MAAARFAVFAEKAGPVLATAREVDAESVLPLLKAKDYDSARQLAAAKEAAKQDIAVFEAILYPADD